MVDGPLRQSGTETRYPWGNHQPGEVRDTSCAAFRCRSPGSSGKPGDLPVGAVINRPPHRGPDGHRRADRGGSSVIKNNLPALGTAGGWDIRWRNKRGILPAQMLCILRQVRWSGFPRLWQPIDSIVALQSAAPHFRAAKRQFKRISSSFDTRRKGTWGNQVFSQFFRQRRKKIFQSFSAGHAPAENSPPQAPGAPFTSDRCHWW